MTKPRGYWQDIENVKREVERVMRENELDTLPTSRVLKKLGESSLVSAINYHGGFHSFRKYIGEEQLQIESGKWQNLEFTIEQARRVMREKKLDTLPSSNHLNRIGETSLSASISKYHGGFHRFRELLGQKRTRIEMKKWQDLEFTIEQARRVIDENNLDTLPSQNVLIDLGESSLSAAIYQYHGGFHKFRRILGQKRTKIEDGKWTNLEFTIGQARRVMEENNLDSLPTQKQLSDFGERGLSEAISSYHGGFHKFRDILGEKDIKVEMGKWANLEFTIEQARRVMEENNLDSLPTQKQLSDFGETSLGRAIIKYHKGFHKFREILGQEQIAVEKGKWKDLEFAIEQAKRVMRENELDTLPTSRVLNQLEKSSLSYAITKYHKGLPNFRKILYARLGINNPIQTESELEDFLNENEEAKKISSLITVTENVVDVAEYLSQLWPDRFPTAFELTKYLPGAVKRIGYSLHPFTMEKARGFYQHTQTLDIATKGALDDLLYKIAVEQYQIKFNLNPEDTMEELKGFSKEKNGISSLAKKVLEYYKSACEFSIPGHGRLRGSA